MTLSIKFNQGFCPYDAIITNIINSQLGEKCIFIHTKNNIFTIIKEYPRGNYVLTR